LWEEAVVVAEQLLEIILLAGVELVVS